MPAEWEPHEATWLAWPHEKTDWPGKFAPIPWVYGEFVRKLARVERVRILVADADAEREACAVLGKSGADLAAIEFLRIPTNRSWTRDYGPIFVKNDEGKLAVTDWHFNGWAKYKNWKRDDAVTSKLLRRLKLPAWQPTSQGRRIVLEGGSIDVNGRGTLLTTEECQLSPLQARNPGLERAALEKIFGDYLGAWHVLWLRRGIAGDDTHGHVDDIARFVDPKTVVAVAEENKSDANYERLQENLEMLRTMRVQDGRPLRVKVLPMPEPVYFDGQRLPASYANFYIANKVVLVPTFNDPKDRIALDVLAGVFPDREMIGIACLDLVLGLGTLHCMTQQQPA
ncbi:MAG TPA: agmatine deiminase family protein [Candidatus Acidoferrales bacterium]|nr:agmatine deiminase family protein [Candidatus Acidoferrales bacterium]